MAGGYLPGAEDSSSSSLEINVKNSPYSAVGDGVADDRTALQAAIDACNAAGGGTVLLPNGTYLVSDTGSAYALNVSSYVTVRGESQTGAIVKLKAGAGASCRPFRVFSANDVKLMNFTVDGNKANQTVDEHRAAIFLWTTNRVLIQDMTLINNCGDAIHVYVTTDTVVDRVNAHDNDRGAISITGGPNTRTYVRNLTSVDNVKALHIESEAACSDLRFESSYCGYPVGIGIGTPVVSLGGITRSASLTDLEIHGGLQIAVDAKAVRVTDCYIEAGTPGGASDPPPLTISFDVEDVVITGCTLYQSAAQGSHDACVFIQASSGFSAARPRGVVLRGNYISTEYIFASGINIVNAQDVHVTDNVIVNPDDSHDRSAAVIVAATDAGYASPQTGNVVVRNNYLYNWSVGVLVGATAGKHIGSLVASGNVLARAGAATCYGWDLDSGGQSALLQCAMSGNDLIGVNNYVGVSPPTTNTPFVTYPPCPILIGGERGGGGKYLCTGTPEGQITESFGATAVRIDGGTGATFYVKETGTGNTGWVAK